MSRWKEKSTWFGVAGLVTSIGSLAKINEAPAIADAITTVAPHIIAGNWKEAVLLLVSVYAVKLREKK